MADLLKGLVIDAASRVGLTGRQSYFLDVTGPANSRELSVVSFTAVERLGEPYRITIELTHTESLARGDYLGHDAAFTIAPVDGTEPRVFSGCITRFSKTKTTKDFSSYELVVEAHIARLNLTRTSRIYQQQSAPQIIEAILRQHGFKGHQFIFKLRRQYPQHMFRFQYQIADWPYIHMLMEQEGIYSYIVPGEHGDIVVFADDIDHYLYQPELTVMYREVAGLQSGVEAVSALQTHVETVPQSFLVADYNPDQAYERFKAEANVAGKDTTTYGQPYVYGTHHLDQGGATWEAQLRHEAAIAWQVVYEGESNVLDLRPARILHMDEVLPDAPNGQVMIEVTHSGARDAGYRNTYKAIPSDRRFRLKLEDGTWPKISGTLSARVTSPGQYKYAYLTQQGYYTVRFDCDFDPWNPGGESVPLRLAKPFAGALQTGFHFPALDKTEAVIEFRDGNPNKPYISQFHHNSQQTDLITNQERWLSRNVIRTQSNNKLRMEDWEGQEGIKLSTEHSGKSQLNLGYLVDKTKQKRGEGIELRTSGYGAIRAGKGLFLSADDRPGAAGQQLDMQAALAQIDSALEIAKALAGSATTAKAIPADTDAQKKVNDELNGLKEPGLLVSAPASIGIVSGHGVQVAAPGNIIAVAGKNVDVSAVKRFTVAAGEAVSMFAQKLGIKLFAAKGPVEIQAQSDAMSLLADKDVTVASVSGKVDLAAAKEIILECGGAFIQLKDGSITLGGPLDLFIKTITIQKTGAASLNMPLDLNHPALAGLPTTPLTLNAGMSPASRAAIPANMPYSLFAGSALVSKGVLDETGLLQFDHHPTTQQYTLTLANGVSYTIPVAEQYRGDAENGALANQGMPFHEGQPGTDAGATDRAEHRTSYNKLLNPEMDV
jgi:type VI secretion system secreted protein VgrG